MTFSSEHEYFARLSAAFAPLFDRIPTTEADGKEHQRLVSRQRARDEDARRAPQQELLPLS